MLLLVYVSILHLLDKLLDNSAQHYDYLYNQGGGTPLHRAAYHNALDVAALLLEKGANLHATDYVCTLSCLYLYPFKYILSHLSLDELKNVFIHKL